MKKVFLLLFVILAAGIIKASEDLGTFVDRTMVINTVDNHYNNDFVAVDFCLEIPANIGLTGAIRFKSVNVFGHYDGVVDLEARGSPEFTSTIPKTNESSRGQLLKVVTNHTSGSIAYL